MPQQSTVHTSLRFCPNCEINKYCFVYWGYPTPENIALAMQNAGHEYSFEECSCYCGYRWYGIYAEINPVESVSSSSESVSGESTSNSSAQIEYED